MILYIDGDCDGNYHKNYNQRVMYSCVYGENGVLKLSILKRGSNNIAEFLALFLALRFASKNLKKDEVLTIKTDSQNNISWFKCEKVGKNVNDAERVLNLQKRVRRLKNLIGEDRIKLVHIPRDQNWAGIYLEDNKMRLSRIKPKESERFIKINTIKRLRKELKKDFGFCESDFSWGCYACYAKLVDNFLTEWEEQLEGDKNQLPL